MQNNFSFERFVNYQDLINTTQYVVKQGDSLFSIAKKYDVAINDIMNLNKLSSTTIYPNQVLFIPKGEIPDVGYKEYITAKGDKIKSILDKTGLEFTEFDKLNKVTNLELAPNQIVKIQEKHGKNTIVLKDDVNLSKILAHHSLTPLELIELNKHLWLAPGTTIIVG